MTSEDSVNAKIISSEVLPGNSKGCPDCGSATLFGVDNDLGYYKRCSNCGHIEYLKRRFLRFDRQSRQWQ